MSRLILLKQGSEASFPLTGDTYAIGRHRNNDIVISDPKVWSFHARVDRGPEGFVLVDLKSRNGCYVNRGARGVEDRRRDPAGHCTSRVQGRLHLDALELIKESW